MAADPAHDVLVADLRSLGRTADRVEPGPDLVSSVVDRIATAPAPTRRRVTGRVAPSSGRGRAVAVLAAVLVALVATPPVRATVADWFGFAGVQVRQTPAPGPTTAPAPPTVAATTDLERAADLVGFDVVVPAVLGPPQGVEVSADRRVLSLSWSGTADGDVRLDLFDGRLDYTVAKTTPGVRFSSVGDEIALWFVEPHEVVVLEPDGTSRTEAARLAGRTLIWEDGDTTVRLEADVRLARALEIAGSATPVP